MPYNNDGKVARCMLLFGQWLWLFVDVSFFLSEIQNLFLCSMLEFWLESRMKSSAFSYDQCEMFISMYMPLSLKVLL